VTVGRGRDADVTLDDPEEFLSRVHARFAVRDGRLHVEDLGSANGTELNGRRVEADSVDSSAELLLGSLKVVCRPE
jgi:pSer/pThr/pTyr-binding forkhead associated (FHA) protein